MAFKSTESRFKRFLILQLAKLWKPRPIVLQSPDGRTRRTLTVNNAGEFVIDREQTSKASKAWYRAFMIAIIVGTIALMLLWASGFRMPWQSP